jgi:hypothetical protein
MANNQNVNKVVINNAAVIDLTADTVDASHLLQGYTAHDASGAAITGTATAGAEVESVDVDTQANKAYELWPAASLVVLDPATSTQYEYSASAKIYNALGNTACIEDIDLRVAGSPRVVFADAYGNRAEAEVILVTSETTTRTGFATMVRRVPGSSTLELCNGTDWVTGDVVSVALGNGERATSLTSSGSLYSIAGLATGAHWTSDGRNLTDQGRRVLLEATVGPYPRRTGRGPVVVVTDSDQIESTIEPDPSDLLDTMGW